MTETESVTDHYRNKQFEPLVTKDHITYFMGFVVVGYELSLK